MRNLLFAACLLPLPGVFASAGDGVLKAGRGVAALVSEHPSGAEKLFDKSFFKRISLPDLNRIFSGLYRDNGVVEETLLVSSRASSGHFFFDTSGNYRIPAVLSLNPDSGRIDGLFLSPAYRKDPRLAEVKEGLAALPGRAGLLVMRLGEDREALEALRPDEYFAVGRAIDLYLLGAIVREGLPWGRVLTLREVDKAAGGPLRGWPAGAPLTLHTLAALMISERDGTAADALVSALGRRTVEASLAPLGHSAPARLRPFLKASEEARLAADTGLALKYLNLPEAEKYYFLDRFSGPAAKTAPPARSAFGLGRIGWQASPSDLCRLISYLEKSGDSKAWEIMALNKGAGKAAGGFLYAARAGGAAPGMLSAAWLLKNKKSERFCLAAVWNEEGADLDEVKFSSLVDAALEALAASK